MTDKLVHKRACSHAVKMRSGWHSSWTCGLTQTRYRDSAVCKPSICPTYNSMMALRNIAYNLKELNLK